MVNVNRKGESVGAFYGYRSQGIVRERHLLYTPPYNGTRLQEGDIKFIDKDGDGNVTEKDRTVIGNPNPSYRYGLSTHAAWRNLSLTVTMDGAADFDIMNLNLLNTATFATGNYSNLRSDSYRKAYPGRRRAAAERRRRRRRLFALRRGRLLPAAVERTGKLPVRHRQEVAPERRSGIHGQKPLRPDRIFGLFAHGGQLHLRPEPLRRGQRFLSARPDFPPEHQSNVLIL